MENKKVKAVNIRNISNKAKHRKSMGLFKKNAYEKKRTQEQELTALVKFGYRNGYYDRKN